MAVEMEVLDLRSDDDLPLRVDLRHDRSRPVRGKVIVCHGFKGFRRWGFFPWVGEQLAVAGWMSAVLDFSHNGIGEDPEEFGRLDLFESNCYSKEMSDLETVLAAVRAREPVAAPVALLGHSRAAMNVVVCAGEQPRIGAVVTWNGVAHALRISSRQLEQMERERRLEFTNARTGQRMAMSFDFVQDLRDNADRFDLQRVARHLAVPHLIVHAAADMAVPFEEASLLQAGRENPARCRVLEIAGSTHTFGATHPFAGTTPALEEAMNASLDWLDQNLDGGHA